MFDRHLLIQSGNFSRSVTPGEASCRSQLVKIAAAEVGVREETNHNDGKRVEAYLSLVGLHKGQAWCAAFCSWVFAQEGFVKPRSGWSPDLFPKSRLARSALPGNLIGIYFPELKRIAHVGMIERTHHDWCFSIEGNTSLNGSIGGVYRRRRHLKTIYRIADWVGQGRRIP